MKLLFFGLLLGASLAFAEDAPPPKMLAIYEQGKSLYDGKRYEDALAKFDEVTALEPRRARWQYNRGLALKKLGRAHEAVAAFMKSRELDPAYKRAEIDEKLSELPAIVPPPTRESRPAGDVPAVEAADAASSTSSAREEARLFRIGFVVLMVMGTVVLIWRKVRKARGEAAVETPVISRNDPAAVENLARAVNNVGARCTPLEHALSLGDDADGRAYLDRAFNNLRMVRRESQRVRHNQAPIRPLEEALVRANEAVNMAEERLRAVHGGNLETARGPRVGCFFCARPLPVPSSRHALTLVLKGERTDVVACLVCARSSATNRPQNVTLVGNQHWSTVDDFDPYVHAFVPHRGANEVGLVPFSRTLSEISSLGALAGAAGIGAVAGLGAAQLLDLDSLVEEAAASAAVRAAAQSAARRQESSRQRNWNDNS